MRVVDQKQAEEAQAAPLSACYKAAPHWNAHGHALAGRTLFEEIRAHGVPNWALRGGPGHFPFKESSCSWSDPATRMRTELGLIARHRTLTLVAPRRTFPSSATPHV